MLQLLRYYGLSESETSDIRVELNRVLPLTTHTTGSSNSDRRSLRFHLPSLEKFHHDLLKLLDGLVVIINQIR